MSQTVDAQEVLLWASERTTPAVAVAFDGADAFRYDMGVELFEHSAPFRDPVATHDGIMDVPLTELLWYRPADSVEADDTQRMAAVVTCGVGAGRVFRHEYDLEVVVGAGRGVGYLTAAIDSGVLALEEVLRWIAVDGLSEPQLVQRASKVVEAQSPAGSSLIGFRAANDLMESLHSAAGVDSIVDLGPGDAPAVELRASPSVTVPVGSWDSPVDRLAVRNRIARHTFYNPAYLVERTLGQLASTRTLPSATDTHGRIIELARRLKALLRTEEPPTSVLGSERDRVTEIVREAISCWVTNGLVKGYSPLDIIGSLVALEHETLLRIRTTFDLTAHDLDPRKRSGTDRAS